MRRQSGVSVVGIKRVRSILPHEGMRKTLGLKLFPQRVFVNARSHGEKLYQGDTAL
jgi:ribosomal protein S13